MDTLSVMLELFQTGTEREKMSMIVQMSSKSKIYHRPGCQYLNRIKEGYLTLVELQKKTAGKLSPCKCCCKLSKMYGDYEPAMKKILEEIDGLAKLEENRIKIQAKNYCWEIRFDPAKQHFRLYKKIWDETIGRTNLIQCSGYDGKEETGQLEKIIALLVGKERTASYPEAYRKAAWNIERQAKEHHMSIEYDGDILYVLTDMAAWKIVFFDRKQCYKLFHCPFGGKKMTMEQAKKARYHRQVDAGENSHPAKYLKYIAGHDRAKKIMEQDYHLLPQRSNKEKMYYTQARKREARKSTRRVWNLFAELEAQQEGFQKLSFC